MAPGAKWTPELEATLQQHVDQGWNIKEMARMMNRTEAGISSRLCKLACDKMDNGSSVEEACRSVNMLVHKDAVQDYLKRRPKNKRKDAQPPQEKVKTKKTLVDILHLTREIDRKLDILLLKSESTAAEETNG